MKKTNRTELVCCIFSTIYIIILIIAFVGSFVAAYYIGALTYLNYVESVYSSEYNMTTGCLLNDTYCESKILNCYKPFYRNCGSGGMAGIFTGLMPIIMIFAIIIICSSTCGCCNCCFKVNENNNQTNHSEEHDNDTKIELQTNNRISEKSYNENNNNIGSFKEHNKDTFIVVDSNEKPILSLSCSSKEPTSSSFINLSSSNQSSSTINVNESIGDTSRSY